MKNRLSKKESYLLDDYIHNYKTKYYNNKYGCDL